MGQICMITRPAPFGRMVAKSGSNWIHMNVMKLLANEFMAPDVNGGEVLQPNSVGLSRRERFSEREFIEGRNPIFIAQPFENFGGGPAFQSSCQSRYVHIEWVCEQMEMIRHDHVADQFEWLFRSSFRQRFDKVRTVPFVRKDRNPLVRDSSDVVNEIWLV